MLTQNPPPPCHFTISDKNQLSANGYQNYWLLIRRDIETQKNDCL